MTSKYIIACQKGKEDCKPIEIIRKGRYYKCSINFENDFPVSSITLLDSSYMNQTNLSGVQVQEVEKIKSYHINANKEFTINFTKLPDGKYFVTLFGDSSGYMFPVKLISKR